MIIEYRDTELRTGMIFESWITPRETLRIADVVYRPGRGLELHTQRMDGYCGPHMYPHPDETVRVLYAPPVGDESWREWNTRDYPYARVIGVEV